MLSDRAYMRSDYPRRNTSMFVWLIAVLVSAYILELVMLSPWFASGAALVDLFPLTVRSLQHGQIWTLLTHSFLHSAGNPFHLLFTILGLVFIGRELEPMLGARRFLGVYAGAIVLGALGWAAVHWLHGGAHIGASAGLLGLFVVLACVYPNQEISFLVFFLFPVTLRPMFFVYGLLVLDAFGLLFYEVLGSAAPFGFTPSAHLGGMLAGWLYFRFLHANNGWDRAAGLALPAWLQRRAKGPAAAKSPPLNHGRSTADFRAEVDRILDKINSQGFGALTEGEKRILDEAKDLLSRH